MNRSSKSKNWLHFLVRHCNLYQTFSALEQRSNWLSNFNKKWAYYERNKFLRKKRYYREGNFMLSSRIDWRGRCWPLASIRWTGKPTALPVGVLDETLMRGRGTQQSTSAQGRPRGESGRVAGAERHSVSVSLRGGLQRSRSCAALRPSGRCLTATLAA